MFKSFTTKFNSRNSSQSSFAPLNPSGTKQDPERVFGELASTYGFNAGVPTLPPKSSSPSTKSRRQPPLNPNMVSPSPSTKNYEKSYGDLVSTYGFGAGVPCLPPTQKKPKSTTKTSTFSPTPPTYVKQQPPSSSQKNYELAFGELSSSYGFGGPLPSLPKSK